MADGIVGFDEDAGVGASTVEAGVGAELAGAQAVRIALKHIPTIKIFRSVCIGISPSLKKYTPPVKNKFPELLHQIDEVDSLPRTT